MNTVLMTSKGVPVELGMELGRGGEGSVHDVPKLSGSVAKLYHSHKTPDSKKAAKLAFMATGADQTILQYAAWPQETLHARQGGPVVGFLMPKVSGREPIHMLYGPAHRRQQYPKASWEFLLLAARNTAAAFEALHARGHVLADVNQGNVMVGSDAKVVLIDCDSFQVNANGTIHLCEVGVSHFTPPELQGLPSFAGVKRTPNHDSFGLALLIFHLLYGGRHPYSGVPLRDDVGESLETDIKAFRYAYARDSQLRGNKPPPASIPTSMVPELMVVMFEAAFTENGAKGGRPDAKGGRPDAKHWVQTLDTLRGNLRNCSVSPAMHVFPSHLKLCPWCSLDNQGAVYFVDVNMSFTTSNGFVLAQVWALIDAVPLPPPAAVPSIAKIAVTPNPLPVTAGSATQRGFLRLFAIAVTIGLVLAFPAAWFLIFAAGAFGFWKAGEIGQDELKAEKTRRNVALETAERDYSVIEARLRAETGLEGFSAKKKQLLSVKSEYTGLNGEESKELEKLKSTAEVRQRQEYLEKWHIDSATIKGVGASNKAALRSFGIETAADVSWNKVNSVKGFGDVKTRAVVDWRMSCERRFTFDPGRAVSEADKNAVKARFAAKRRSLEAALTNGASELQSFSHQAARKTTTLWPTIKDASQKLAQARADISLF